MNKRNFLAEHYEAVGILLASGGDDIYAEHDQIWVGGRAFSTNNRRLKQLGWFWDEDSWSSFV